jgi:hypothetical protein
MDINSVSGLSSILECSLGAHSTLFALK